ncbi:MAG: deaminase [Candidatus Glassbacteria bacterium]|nr:deaminase [Candidatus Glassbacteria bacterium]
MKNPAGLVILTLAFLLLASFAAGRRGFSRPAEETAPAKPLMPFAQAVKAGGFIFVSGQIGRDPQTGKVAGEDIGAQTRQALENIEAVLKKAGAGLEDIVKTTVYLQNMDDYAAMNRAYAGMFGENLPARATVAVRGLVLGVLVEIDAVVRDPGQPGGIIRM